MERKRSSWSSKEWALVGIVAPLVVAAIVGGFQMLVGVWARDDQDPTPEFYEARFRILQVDELTYKVVDGIRSASAEDDRGMQGAFQRAPLLKVAAELGGVTSMPLGENATVWIGGSGYGVRHLPRKRGYQNPQFANIDLKELSRRYYIDQCASSPPIEELASLEQVISEYREAADTTTVAELPRIASNLHEYAKWRERTNLESVEAKKQVVEAWTDHIRIHWENVKSHKLLVPFQEPAPAEEPKC